MMTSPSSPMTSVTWVMRREPSRMTGSAWMMMSIEPTIISRMVFDRQREAAHGNHGFQPAHRLAWASWRAACPSSRHGRCSSPAERSNASGPRTSPTIMRSGRMRRQFRTRSRIEITAPEPSRLGGRVSRRTTWGCCSWSSAASSQVMTRSSVLDIGGHAVEQRGLARTGAAGDQDVAAAACRSPAARAPPSWRDRAEA